jgi:hypothetical protein
MFTGLEGFDPAEIVACALRPRGSWLHLATLAGFVVAARLVGSPPRARESIRL